MERVHLFLRSFPLSDAVHFVVASDLRNPSVGEEGSFRGFLLSWFSSRRLPALVGRRVFAVDVTKEPFNATLAVRVM